MAILDEEALLAVGMYIDLNPVAAGIAVTSEVSTYTSLKMRVDHVEAETKADQLHAASCGSVAGSRAAAGRKDSLWLCPIEDRRQLDSPCEDRLHGFSLGSYLLLVDYTARLFRNEKTALSLELAGLFDRLGSSADSWRVR